MFARDVISEISKAAQSLDIEPAALLAVADVESGGVAFTTINGRKEPLIRFEAHYFDRRLSEKNRAIAREKGLAAPVAGAIANPGTQAARWRMLDKAAAIDAKAAYESVSWGLGQVMGAHWAWLGYASVEALVAEARSGIAGQTRLMALYIEKAGLAKALRDHDWASFARGYNGPAYAGNAYDRKIAGAYASYANAEGNAVSLRRGSKGTTVAQLQNDLAALGYPLTVDGIFGPVTARMVRRFQNDHALAVDGIAGPRTLTAIRSILTPASIPQSVPRTGFWTSLKGWITRLFNRG